MGLRVMRSKLVAFLFLFAGLGLVALPACARDAAAPQVRSIQAQGLTFRSLSWGPENGRPVLLLHGFPQDADSWSVIAQGLAREGYRVVAFDQRGYSVGARPSGAEHYRFDLFIDDALAVADAYGFKQFNIVGFGMGGAQSWMLTARHPERVKSIVALRFPHPAAFAAGIRNDPEQAQSWAKLHQDLGAQGAADQVAALLANDAAGLKGFLSKSGLPEPQLTSYVERLKQPGALAGAKAWEQAVSLDEFAKVATITRPTLYIWSKGPALTATTAQSTHNFVKSEYRIEEIDGGGNFMVETSSDAILKSMLSFYGDVYK